MKRYFFIPVFLLAGSLASRSYAQFGENFGVLTANEISMKVCAFDEDAQAIMLLDEAMSNYNNQYNLITNYHQRIKVLKKEGIEHGSIKIAYRGGNNVEHLSDIQAVTINYDENGRRHEYPVDKKLVYHKKVNEILSEMSFAFPQVQVGSILELRYTSQIEHYGYLKDWAFQTSLPVSVSRYILIPAPNLEFSYQVQSAPKYPVNSKPYGSNEGMIFEMKDIPGLENEPYMDARKDYLQMVRFTITRIAGHTGNRSYMSSWNEVARTLSAEPRFGGQLKAKLPAEQAAFLASMASKSPLEKMKLIHNYIRDGYAWDGYIGKYADPGVKALHSSRKGNSAAINLAFVNLLQEAGLEAYPMIVSERSNGKVNTKVPFVNQFNDTYAAVVVDGTNYYIDATDPTTPTHITPKGILNTHALIVKKNQGILVEVKEDRFKYQDAVLINSDLSEEGTLSGHVQLVSRDYSRSERLYAFRNKRQKYEENYLLRGLANVEIDSLTLENENNDMEMLRESFNFRTGIQTTGEYGFININFFTGFESNPFLSSKRFSNINFGYKRTLVLTNIIGIPASYSIDALPKNIRMINGDKTVSFVREIIRDTAANKLVCRVKIDLEKSYYDAEEYLDLKEFFQKMTEMLNEQIVLKKSI